VCQFPLTAGVLHGATICAGRVGDVGDVGCMLLAGLLASCQAGTTESTAVILPVAGLGKEYIQGVSRRQQWY
jgi:hypothetical protein